MAEDMEEEGVYDMGMVNVVLISSLGNNLDHLRFDTLDN
jgi:hypothetical protein